MSFITNITSSPATTGSYTNGYPTDVDNDQGNIRAGGSIADAGFSSNALGEGNPITTIVSGVNNFQAGAGTWNQQTQFSDIMKVTTTLGGAANNLLLNLVAITLALTLKTLQLLSLVELTMQPILLRQPRVNLPNTKVFLEIQVTWTTNLDTYGSVFLIRGAKKFASLFLTYNNWNKNENTSIFTTSTSSCWGCNACL